MDSKVFERNGEIYVQSFLLGKYAPYAIDPNTHKPQPFGFADVNAIEKIAKTAIGMPYIARPKKTGGWEAYHVSASSAKELYEKQKGMAWGEIVNVYVNPKTGNANAIWKPFPQYVDKVKRGEIPPFTSPYLVNVSGASVDKITDGQIAHLHGVPSSGFEPQIASIQSVCTKGLQECMTELKHYAAAGKLQNYQNSILFKHLSATSNNNMSQEGNPQQNGDLASMVASIDQRVGALEGKFDDLAGKIESALPNQTAAAGEEQSQQLQEPSKNALGNRTQETPSNPDPQANVDSLKARIEQLETERKQEKEALQKRQEALSLKERENQVREIVEAKLKLKLIPLEKREEETKRLMELKDDNGKLLDLSTVHSELTSQADNIVAASGNGVIIENPGISIDDDKENKVSPFSVMSEIGSI